MGQGDMRNGKCVDGDCMVLSSRCLIVVNESKVDSDEHIDFWVATVRNTLSKRPSPLAQSVPVFDGIGVAFEVGPHILDICVLYILYTSREVTSTHSCTMPELPGESLTPQIHLYSAQTTPL